MTDSRQQLFDRSARATITHQVATTTGADTDRAALVLQEVLDYGPASEHFNAVLPILWEHTKGVIRRAVDHAQAVEEAVASDFAASIDQAEADARALTDHPDYQQQWAPHQ